MEHDKLSIKDIRTLCGLSSKEMANLFHVSLSTFRKKENYHLKLSTSEIIILSLVSQVPIYKIRNK